MSGPDRPRLLGFRIGDAAAALPLAIVREVLPRPAIVEVPGGRPALAGVALAHGIALPVYDLRRILAPGAASSAVAGGGAEHVIVCNWGEVSVGVLGSGPDLLEGDPEPWVPGPDAGGTAGSPEAAGFAAGRLRRKDGEVVTILDATRVFASLGVPVDGSPAAGEGEGEDDPAGR